MKIVTLFANLLAFSSMIFYKEVIAIEYKWSADHFEPSSLKAFRRLYKNGKNYVVANDVKRKFRREYNGLIVEFVSLEQLIRNLSKD